MLFNDKTPIIAIATAPGRGGIGVIRLSFEADLADPILAALFLNAVSNLAEFNYFLFR